jgi:phospholipid transport system substrate-binding protein
MNGSRTAMARTFLTALCLWLFPLFTPAAAQQQAGDPAAPVARLNEAIIDLMKAAEAKTPIRTRLDQFLPALRQTFDLETTLRVAAAPYFDRAQEAERQALLDAFARRSAAQYVDRFTGYKGETIEIAGQRPGPRNTVLVDTRINRRNDEPVLLSYVLRQREGRWGIVDVLLDGNVSQLAVQRSDYANTLRTGGLPALTRELQAYADRVVASR